MAGALACGVKELIVVKGSAEKPVRHLNFKGLTFSYTARTFHVPLDQLTDLAPGPKTPDYPGDCRIHNNLMHDLGVFGKQVAGVYLSAAQEIHVSHNTICRIPRAGICINEGCWGGHLIEFNDLFLTVLETSDHGPINAWGRDRFWQSPHRTGQECDMSLSRPPSHRWPSSSPVAIHRNPGQAMRPNRRPSPSASEWSWD